jgi:hypothetical protein
MELHQIKKILHIKENSYQNQEISHSTRENLCQFISIYRINIQIIWRAEKNWSAKEQLIQLINGQMNWKVTSQKKKYK